MNRLTGSSSAPSGLLAPEVTEATPDADVGRDHGRQSPFLRLIRTAARLRRTKVGLGLLSPVVLLAVVGPALAPHDPIAALGIPFAPPTRSEILGLDGLGRDVLSRLLSGGVSTLGIAFLATSIAAVAGTMLGLFAAVSEGPVGTLTMRALDVIIAFPQYVMILLFVVLLGSHTWLTVALVAVVWTPQIARVMRSAALTIVTQDYVQYSLSLGTRKLNVMLSDVLPNVTAPLSVEFGIRLTLSIALVAGLGFLGFGPPPPTPSWGAMISENQAALAYQPWATLAPVMCIALLTIGVNLVTDGVAQANARASGR